MAGNPSLISELEDAMASSSDNRRNETLRQVTDLFLGGAPKYSEPQVAVFDDVIGRLAKDADVSTKAELSQKLATIENAPINTVRTLAADDTIDVAGPVLANSNRLSDSQLADLAASKGQHHMLAIARRRDIGEQVTDALIKRGNPKVTQAVATNASARVSEKGYETLVNLAEGDVGLAESIAQRPDIPHKHFKTLIAMAPAAVQQRLASVNPRLAERIRGVIAEAAAEADAPVVRDYTRATETVTWLGNASRLGDEAGLGFGKPGQFAETLVARAVLVQMPIPAMAHVFTNEPVDTLLIVARVAGLTWPTTKQLLVLRAGRKPALQDLEGAKVNFVRLRPETAKQGLQLYKIRFKQK
jgi:hypothetical protein